MFPHKKITQPWEGRVEPFKIIGNVYFVGTVQASCHLIDTGDGLILIDTGYFDGLYMIIDSIYKLGFDPKDIRYIVHSHWHWDHAEATPALVDLTGAKTVIGKKDEENVKRYFNPDITVEEGDVLTLGNTSISFMETPGHTRGTVSIFFETEENGKKYRLGMFGGAGANTLKQGAFDYEGCQEDYRNSLNRLRKEKVDVFIGNHTWNNDTVEKGKRLQETGVNEFIDGDIWFKFLDFCEERLDKTIAQDI